MAIGDVIGSTPGPWFFDMDGNGAKSRRFPTEAAAREAGASFKAEFDKDNPARQAAIDAEEAAKIGEPQDGGLSINVLAAAYAAKLGRGG